MRARFAERVVVVTGGASGIGAATARAFADEGARVVVADVDRGSGERVASEIGGRFRATDVAREADVGALVAETERALGAVDVLVSNAFVSAVGALETLSLAAWEQTMTVTLTAVFTGLRAVLPGMRRRGDGAVVNVASISGLGGDPGLAAYNAAKGGVVNLTRAAALEVAGSGVRVNAVCPGLVDTPALARAFHGSAERRRAAEAAIPMRRLARAAEVAAAILFLASDDASYVTGATLVVDGGLTAGSGVPESVRRA